MKKSAGVLIALFGMAFMSSGCVVTVGSSYPTTVFSGISTPIALEETDGKYDAIYVTASAGEPQVELATGNTIKVTATLMSETMEAFNNFFHETQLANTITNPLAKELPLHIGGPLYQCSFSNINGNVSVRGVCIQSVVIQLPAKGKTKVFFNGAQIVAQGPIPLSSLMARLHSLPFDDGRSEQMRKFIASHEAAGESRFLTAMQAKEILDTYTFDDGRLQAAEMMSGKIVDPLNAVEVAEVMTFDSHKVEIIRILSH